MADMTKVENMWFGEETEPEDLGTIEMPDICTDDPWAITDYMGADYAMRKIREIRKDAETWIDFYQAQIDKIKDDAMQEAVYYALALLFSIPVLVMRREFGWGAKRLERFSDKLTEYYFEYDKSKMQPEAYRQMVLEETGMSFEVLPEVVR
jgi:hypothetical protein